MYSQVYGSREDVSYTGSVCLEVRQPGYPIQYINESVGLYEDRTKVTIRTINTAYMVSEIAEGLMERYPDDIISGLESEVFKVSL